ncbi:uncharacterized protein LOC142176004 [Nicotiana tabacum]|uniref:Uncharacterized protein LOC142176004 n=1 Tax=Nicotiana tabacum TaxID=4097 RepID=A0AC58TPI8_TOBAC
MLQAQQVAIAQLQSQNRTPNTAEPVNTRRVEPAIERPDESGSGTDPTIMKMLEELAKRIKIGEKKIEENDKKVETYNSGGLNERSSIASKQLKKNLVQYPTVTWADVYNRYQSKIRVEDDQLGAPSGSVYPSRLLTRESGNADRGSRSNKERYQPYVEDRRNISKRNIPRNDRRTEQAIGKIRDTIWPKPIQTDPSQRNPNLICKYHGTHGHRTEDCRQLKEEVARLFNEWYLREFLSDQAKSHFRERDANKKNEPEEPQHIIHMLVGGVDVLQGPIFKRNKVSITREKRTRDYMPEGTLTFREEDTEALSQPHNDALVISILLNKIQVKLVLVDPSSSTNIIRSRVVEKIGLLDQIIPSSYVLNGFNIVSEMTKREIILPVNVVGTIQDTKFHVIEGDMRYNALLRRPWIHSMRAVPSTLHQMMKFPTKDGVKIVYGEQHAAKGMFAVHDLAPVSTPSTSEKSKDKKAAK